MFAQNQVIRLAVDNDPPAAPNVFTIHAKHGDTPNILGCEERFQTLVDSVTDYAIFILDPAGNVKSWNRGAQRIKGYESAEILGCHFSRFYTGPDLKRGKPKYHLEVAASVGRCEDEGYRVRKDGTTFWANVVLTAVRDEKEKLLGFVKITRDLTDRRNAEIALLKSEEQFRALVTGISDYGVFMLNPDGLVTSWNAGAERLLGYSAGQIIGHHFSLFFSPDDVESGLPARELEIAAMVGHFSCENWRQRRDGSRIWASVTVSRLLDASGQLIGYAKVTQDLTMRKEADERLNALRQDLEQRNAALATANADLEAFSRSMAHDLKAPVRHVLAYAEILLRDYKEVLPAEAIDHVEHLKLSATRMSDLVRDLLGWFSIVRRPVTRRPVELQPLVKLVVAEFAVETINRNVEWRIGNLFDIECDRGLVLLVFQNLIGNALKFTRGCDRAVIEIGHVVTDTDRVIFVRDNGTGFNMQYAGKLFHAFERLHAQSDFEGTGIGLTITARIVQKHGGRIWADAVPDHGATFSFTLETPAVK